MGKGEAAEEFLHFWRPKIIMSEQFVWKEEYNLGVDIIDEEHKRLFEFINNLYLLTQKKRGLLGNINDKRACRKALDYFKEHAIQHFADEEEYMALTHYEGLEQHKRIHDGFRENTLPALGQELEQNGYSLEAVEHFLGVCAGWLIGHTTLEDQAIVGKRESLLGNLTSGEELESIKKVITQLSYNMFCVKAKMLSTDYNGERFGKGIYYRLVYETEKGEKHREVFLAFEEKLLYNAVGGNGKNQMGKLSTSLLHTARYTLQRFSSRMMSSVWPETGWVFKEENLLTYEQFQKIFKEEQPIASLLFDTGEGYFSCCILTPLPFLEQLGTPIKAENAMEEVLRYVKEREVTEQQAPKKKILVVDDSATMRQGMENLLKENYEVSVADSGVAAIRAVTLNKPDLVLLDYDMPVCNGRQTLELLRSEASSADLPVIFLTSRDDTESVKGVLSLGVSGYMLKSLKPAMIKARINEFFINQK